MCAFCKGNAEGKAICQSQFYYAAYTTFFYFNIIVTHFMSHEGHSVNQLGTNEWSDEF